MTSARITRNSRILIVGHRDVTDTALAESLRARGCSHVVSTAENRWDVLDPKANERSFKKFRPQYVFMTSVRSGGIEANQRFPAEFIYENLAAQNNIIAAARRSGVKKLLYIASSCVYPKVCSQPMKEEALLTGALEPTSEPYAVAKIAGIKLCQAYRRQYGLSAIAAVPATVYGPGSPTDLATAHVMGALIAKFHLAAVRGEKKVALWGTGRPRREFLFSEDFAEAMLFLMERFNGEGIINAGCGGDVPIRDLARLVADVCGFRGKIVFDTGKPDGAMRKLLSSSRIRALGWRPRVSLEEGVARTYEWYRKTTKSTKR